MTDSTMMSAATPSAIPAIDIIATNDTNRSLPEPPAEPPEGPARLPDRLDASLASPAYRAPTQSSNPNFIHQPILLACYLDSLCWPCADRTIKACDRRNVH